MTETPGFGISRLFPRSDSTLLASPLPVGNVNVDSWAEFTTEKFAVCIGVHPSQQQFSTGTPFVPTTDPHDIKWFSPWPNKLRFWRSQSTNSSGNIPALSTPAGVTTVIDWDFAIPIWTRPNVAQIQAQQFFTFDTDPTPADFDALVKIWLPPVRPKPGLGPQYGQFIAFHANPIPADVDAWFKPLAEPVRAKSGLQHQQLAAWSSFTPTATATVDGWVQRWAEPQKPISRAALQQSLAFYPTPITSADGWTDFATERFAASLGLHPAQQQFTALSPTIAAAVTSFVAAPFAEVPIKRWLDVLRRPYLEDPCDWAAVVWDIPWFAPFTNPIRVKLGLPAGEQQALAWSQLAITTTPPADGWVQPFAEVPKPKVSLRASLQQFLAFNPLPLTAPADGWIQRWADPQKPIARAQQQQTLAFHSTPLPATVDGWVSPFAEVPKRRTFATSLQQFLAFDATVPIPPNVAGWYGPWYEPAKPKVSLAAHQQQFLAFDTLLIPPTGDNSWYSPWPNRQRFWVSRTNNSGNIVRFTPPPPAPPADGWVSPFAEVPKRKTFHASQQQFFTFNPFPIPPPDGWIDFATERFAAFSGLHPSQQQVLAYSTTVIPPTDGWTDFATERFAASLGLHPSRQQTLAFDPFPRPSVATPSLGWFSNLTTPPLPAIKVSASVANFLAVATEVTVDTWFERLSEPTRTRKFSVAAQQFLAFNPFPITATDGWTDFATERFAAFSGLHPSQQQVLAYANTVIPPADGWTDFATERFAAFTGLHPSQQQFAAYSNTIQAIETITYDKWGYRWSEPVRTPNRFVNRLPANILPPFTAIAILSHEDMASWRRIQVVGY